MANDSIVTLKGVLPNDGVNGVLKGILNNNSDSLRAVLGSENTIKLKGILSNAALRGYSIQLQMNGDVIQYKYEDDEEWIDLCDIGDIVEEAVHDIDHYKLVDTLPTGDNIQPGMIYVLREN